MADLGKFDLAKFDTATLSDTGVAINILDPLGDVLLGGDGQPIQFIVLGQDSKKFKADIDEARKQAQSKVKQRVKSVEERDAEDVERIAGYTVGWTDNFSLDGKPFPYSNANAIKFYSDRRFRWIYEQINREIMNRANFLQA